MCATLPPSVVMKQAVAVLPRSAQMLDNGEQPFLMLVAADLQNCMGYHLIVQHMLWNVSIEGGISDHWAPLGGLQSVMSVQGTVDIWALLLVRSSACCWLSCACLLPWCFGCRV